MMASADVDELLLSSEYSAARSASRRSCAQVFQTLLLLAATRVVTSGGDSPLTNTIDVGDAANPAFVYSDRIGVHVRRATGA